LWTFECRDCVETTTEEKTMPASMALH
jgi:hypothetical protein